MRITGSTLIAVGSGLSRGWVICRKGDAVACTLAEPVPGFRGLRHRWWDRAAEVAFPDWRVP